MRKTKSAKFADKKIELFAWLLSAIVAALAFIAWGQGSHWRFNNVTSYKLFPLFGLLAFSLMWSVYVVSFFKSRLRAPDHGLKSFYHIIPITIFAAILIHPSILIWQLFRDGFGLPPGSYFYHYVAAPARWAVVISTTAFFVFLAYEFRYKYRQRHWWKYMEYVADLALIGIYFHALKLGSNLQRGWYRYVWLFYGAVLIIVLSQTYLQRLKEKTPAD